MDYFICRTFSPVLSLLFSLTMDFVMSKIFFIRCIIFSLSHFPMSNKFCGSYNGVENYLSNIICWQTCQTLLSICRKHSVALHKACRTFSVEHFDVENLPWSMGKCIVEHFLSKIVCFPVILCSTYFCFLKSSWLRMFKKKDLVILRCT